MGNEQRLAKPGEVVIFHDPKGNPHNALVTVGWSETCINLVLVSTDGDKQDTYGRQIERETSVQHVSATDVHGNYWRFPGEAPNMYTEPKAS